MKKKKTKFNSTTKTALVLPKVRRRDDYNPLFFFIQANLTFIYFSFLRKFVLRIASTETRKR